MPLFEVAIIQKPTKKEEEEGGTETLIFGPKPAIGKDGQAAAMQCVMQAVTREQLNVDLQQCEVLVRPFV